MYFLAYLILGAIISLFIEIVVNRKAKITDSDDLIQMRSTREDNFGTYVLALMIVTIIWLPLMFTSMFKDDNDVKFNGKCNS